jgi:methyl-accepting chemotaxis protein
MVDKLKDVYESVKSASDNVASGSQQLSSSSEEMSQGATEQGRGSRRSIVIYGRMTSNIKQNAEMHSRQSESP